MANATKRINKDGSVSYEIQVSRGRGKAPYSMRWQAPETWSEKVVQRELTKVCADFERRCKNGEVLTNKERKAEEQRKAEEASKIQTFEQYTEKVYLPALAVTAKNHTMSSFKGNLKNHIYPHIGQIKLPEITSAEIDALLLEKQKELGLSSVSKLYTIIRLILKKAYKNDLIPKNPIDKVDRPKAKQDEIIIEEPESYTADETNYIFECLEHEPFQWQCYIRLMTDTGCRRGEACGLQWKHIDFKNNAVSFLQQLAYTPEDGIYQDTLKNRKCRKIFVDPEIMDMLKKLKEYKYSKNKKIVNIEEGKTEKTKPDERYVFTQILSQSKDKTVYSDDPLHPDSPTRYFKKFGKKYDIDHFHPHKMRHTQASLSIVNGADIVSVSRKLGHSNPSITLKIYAHSSEESQKQASDVFRSALKVAKDKENKG